MTARRWFMWAAAALAVLVVVHLAFWNVSLSNRLSRTEKQAEENRSVAQLACAESNKLRDGLRGLGQLLFEREAQGSAPGTIQHERATGLFVDYFNVAFAALDCDALAN